MYFIGFLILGVAIGWLAGHVMTGSGYGAFWDMVVGAVGAIVAGLVLSLVFGTLLTGLLIAYLAAVVSAAVLVAVVHLAAKREHPTAHPQ